MAYDTITRILREMPLELQRKVVTPDILKSILNGMPAEQRQEIVSFVVLTRALRQMTTEQKRETARALFDQLSKEEQQQLIEQLSD